jgi:hypothetical protein
MTNKELLVKIFHQHSLISCKACRYPLSYRLTAGEIGVSVLAYLLVSWLLIPIGLVMGLFWIIGKAVLFTMGKMAS